MNLFVAPSRLNCECVELSDWLTYRSARHVIRFNAVEMSQRHTLMVSGVSTTLELLVDSAAAAAAAAAAAVATVTPSGCRLARVNPAPSRLIHPAGRRQTGT